MSLYGALFAGVSGLQSQSSAMGAIADNVTNVNTIGYKGTQVNFKTLVTKQVSSTKYSPGGVQSAPRTGVDTQGLLQASTSTTDIGIDGQGFFIVSASAKDSTGFAYSRAGSFQVDKDGYLQNTSGYYLQGWPLENWDGTSTASQVVSDGSIYMKSYKNSSGDTYYMNDNAVDAVNLQPLNIKTIGGTARATSTMSLGANLPGGTSVAIGTTAKTSPIVYDTLGNSHSLNFTWMKQATNKWGVELTPPQGATYVALDDQSSPANTYFAAGRLDFTAIPKSGSSYTMGIGGQNYTFNFNDTTSGVDDTVGMAVSSATVLDSLDLTATDTFGTSDTITMADGTVFTITTSPSADTDIDITGLSTPAEINDRIQKTMESYFDNKYGSGNWTSYDSTTNTFKSVVGFANPAVTPLVHQKVTGTPAAGESIVYNGSTYNIVSTGAGSTGTTIDIQGLTTPNSINQAIATAIQNDQGAASTFTYDANLGQFNSTAAITTLPASQSVNGASYTVASTASVAGGLPVRAFNIDITGKSMSEILDLMGKQVNTALGSEFGVPSDPPGSWGGRVAGENSLIFRQGSGSDFINLDVTNLKDSNGNFAVLQTGDEVTHTWGVPSLDGISPTLNASTGAVTGNYAVEFNGDGSIDKIMGHDENDEPDPRLQVRMGWSNGAADQDGTESAAVSLFIGNYNSKDGLQQMSGAYSTNYMSQNGNKFGNFSGVSVGEDGIVTAKFDNGVTTPIFMIPMATFVNANGMTSLSGNVFQQTDISGLPTVREAGSAGAGTTSGGSLESSTVDLGTEFTAMITTQRAYSAAAKIITTADQMLDELVNIKR